MPLRRVRPRCGTGGHTVPGSIYIDKHFGAIGGFSTRRHINEFVTVLPYSDLAEAENILKDFVKDFQERGIQ